MAVLSDVFPSQAAAFPCPYLGIPLSIYCLRRTEEQPLVDEVAARIPTWKSGLLTVSSSHSCDTVCHACPRIDCNLPLGSRHGRFGKLTKRRRAFLWAGTDSVTGGRCKVNWRTVCSPTVYGRLGVSDLRIVGFTLEWLRRTKPELGWTAFPVKKTSSQ